MTFILEKPLSSSAELTAIALTMLFAFLVLGGIQWFSRFFSTYFYVVSKVIDIDVVEENFLESAKHFVFVDFSNWFTKMNG